MFTFLSNNDNQFSLSSLTSCSILAMPLTIPTLMLQKLVDGAVIQDQLQIYSF